MDYSNIKLIGIDLDGTLLHDDKTMSPRTKKAIETVSQKNIEVVPITGRPYAGIPNFLKEMPEIHYIIYSNGSQIMHNGKSLFSFALPNQKAKQVISILRTLDCQFELFSNGWGYIEPDVNKLFHSVFSEDSPIGQYIFGSCSVVESIEGELDKGIDADEIFIICKTPDVRQSLIDSISNIDGVHHWNLDDIFIEITNEGTDKGEALTALCKHLDIELKDTMTFGDGENDLTFLQKAGIGVVMQNANDIVKQYANILTLSNEEDGVAHILEQI